MYRRVPLWAVALVFLALAGLTVAQGYQPNFIRNLVGPVAVTGALSTTGALTVGNGTTTGGVLTPSAGALAITTVEDADLDLTATGAGLVSIDASSGISICGTSATSCNIGHGTTQATAITGAISFGGGPTFTKFLSDVKAVTGASINAGLCANQGTTITLTGAAAGDSCYLGLSASPGNGLAYSCVVGSNTCQIVACNASAGSLTSLTGTHRCTVIH